MEELIVKKLREIEKEKHILILFAIESGSRAWGFSSTDSDYDVRYIFVRPAKQYLNLVPPDKTITIMDLDNDLDMVGWDLNKTLFLMLKGNHQVREWLRSPIVYTQISGIIPAMHKLALQVNSKTTLQYSYASLLNTVIKQYLNFELPTVALKKYFYAIRCACVLRWIDQHDSDNPPMNLLQLLEEIIIPVELYEKINDLIALKQNQGELGQGLHIEIIDDFINSYTHYKGEKTTDPNFGPIDDYNQFWHQAIGLADLSS